MKLTQSQIEAKEWFLKHCPKGSTIHTVLRSVSRSGMSRVIGLVVIKQGRSFEGPKLRQEAPTIFHPNYSAAEILGWRMATGGRDGVKVSGCGMDMGYHLVYTLSQAVYGDGYALKQEWI